MSRAWRTQIVVMLLVWCVSEASQAERDDSRNSDQSVTPSSPLQSDAAEADDSGFPRWIMTSGNWLELQRDSFSDTVMESAMGVDAYLARDNIDESLVNQSHVKFQIRQRFSKSGQLDFETKFKARLRLPNSKRRLKLTFESNPDDFNTISDRRLGLTPGASSPRNVEETAVAGISLEKYLGENWDSSYNLGMKLRLPLDPYVRAHWTHTSSFGDQWKRRFLQRFSYFHTEGWKSDSNFDLYRPLDDNFMFQSSSGAQYLDKEDGWDLYQSLSIHQRISIDTAFEHQIGVSAISRPSLRTSGYWVRTELRHRLYKDWLFGKLVPELFFGRDDNFDLVPSLLFELEVYFGATPEG